jgi:hypothetical protein
MLSNCLQCAFYYVRRLSGKRIGETRYVQAAQFSLFGFGNRIRAAPYCERRSPRESDCLKQTCGSDSEENHSALTFNLRGRRSGEAAKGTHKRSLWVPSRRSG